jgi:hypothetical protein
MVLRPCKQNIYNMWTWWKFVGMSFNDEWIKKYSGGHDVDKWKSCF